MKLSNPSLQYLAMTNQTQGDIFKLEETRFKELQPYLNAILEIRQRTIPARIWNPKTNKVHVVEETHPCIITLESQIDIINEKYKALYEENRKYCFIR